jgi:predicted component of type VI protein secretion system
MSTPLQILVLDRRTGDTLRHAFTAAPVHIGRDPACELRLADPHVSTRHAVLELGPDGVTLRDLGGTNGLRVDGRRAPAGAVLAVSPRLCVDVGPYRLEILHDVDRDRRAVHGAVRSSPAPDLDQLHALLARLHALHAPFVAARRSFEAALADAVAALQSRDPAAIPRLLAEFPPRDRDLHFAAPPVPEDLSPGTSPPSPPDAAPRPQTPPLPTPPSPHFAPLPTSPSPRLTAPPPTPPAPLLAPPPHLPAALSPAPSPSLDHLSFGTSSTAAALLAPLSRALVPGERPPASDDEARRFLERVAVALRDLAAGFAALQQLRARQARDLGLVTADTANPVLALTRGDELLAHLLAWREPEAARPQELLDGVAVLLAHARGHVLAALATARHLAIELAPHAIARRVRGPLRGAARWRAYLARYAACVGDGDDLLPVLRRTFRAAYIEELGRHGVHLHHRQY